jgi:hypothetical protein
VRWKAGRGDVQSIHATTVGTIDDQVKKKRNGEKIMLENSVVLLRTLEQLRSGRI